MALQEDRVARERHRLHAAIAGAVGAIRHGRVDDGPWPLGWLFTSSVRTARICVAELATANAQMLHALSDHPARDVGADQPVVDRFEPAEQAATRMMLAVAHGHPEDAELYLDIALDAGGPAELRRVLAYTVLWTLELLEECERARVAVPDWVRSGTPRP